MRESHITRKALPTCPVDCLKQQGWVTKLAAGDYFNLGNYQSTHNTAYKCRPSIHSYCRSIHCYLGIRTHIEIQTSFSAAKSNRRLTTPPETMIALHCVAKTQRQNAFFHCIAYQYIWTGLSLSVNFPPLLSPIRRHSKRKQREMLNVHYFQNYSNHDTDEM